MTNSTPWLRGSLLALMLLVTACGGGGDDVGTERQPEVAVAEEFDAEWSRNATELRGNDGERYAYTCPPAGSASSVWGTGPYTDDSSVCTAAVHAGLITFDDGGRVVFEIEPGLEAYPEGEANGVAASSWPSWPGSFSFVSR
ncbi:hypothetical protein DVS28_a2419 [Euzebya pacifica]|jgi:hypothetical protein|uniref:LCCL domain-containing protein n=1 Tax=Euzebya pacifica TaxID=1608957 RepID=A0A346XY03_9ACTN|nr:LCCL domain-containing protein [Euzebya pacifica]AXV07100.1 hypothetical protein DVS28_a2419 [Euzebya pacifica]